jgi:single-stranded DNA-specific DHH superfamily exonuclease
VAKQAFDKGELMQEISRTKKQLNFAERRLHDKSRPGSNAAGKENSADYSTNLTGGDDAERSIRLAEQLDAKNKALQTENEDLRHKLCEI